MKKNKLLFVFLFLFLISIMIIENVKAKKLPADLGTTKDFYGQSKIDSMLLGTRIQLVNYRSSDTKTEINIGVFQNDLFGNDESSSQAYYSLIGEIVKYKGRDINTYQIVDNYTSIYTTADEVTKPACFGMVYASQLDHVDDKVWMANWEEDLEELKKDKENDGYYEIVYKDHAIILRQTLPTDNWCKLMYQLSDNKIQIENLKTERKKYKPRTTDYKEINSKILNQLNIRENLLNQLEAEGLKDSTGTKNLEQRRNWVTRQKKLINIAAGSSGEKIAGCDVFGENITPYIKWAINFIRIGGSILVIVYGIIDFMNILLSGEEKNFKESGMRFVKRLIALIVLIFIPYLLVFLLDLSGILKQYGIEDVYCVVKF